MGYKPISDYGIIGNMLSAALVGSDGSIDWCCLPRFDSPSIFAAILDDEKGGRFHIKPQRPFRSHQAYLPNTNILQTTFETETGTATVIDFMPCYQTSRRRLTQFDEIHRLAKCTEGQVALEVVFEPRLNYARGGSLISTSKYGVTVRGEAETLTVSSLIPFAIHGDRAIAQFTLQQGQSADFILRYGSDKPRPPATYGSAAKLERTSAYWQQQAEGCLFPSPWREAIVRSYLALHLLLYSPTGALLAAPTTSLPEQIGGERNWDYRFTWLRDASLTLNAFLHLGHTEEAIGFMKWLITVCGRWGAKCHILYDIDLEDPLKEQELNHLRGYRDSRPVRIGNDAYGQFQLDIFGEVLETAYNYLNMRDRITRRTWRLLESFVNAACESWQRPDSGIWEVRGGPYHFVHSKLMCWVALDRGIKIAEKLGHRKNLARWRKTAQDIRNDILNRGWNQQRGAFTQHYDTLALDASNLLIPLFGFLPISDKRIVSTIEHTMEELSWNGLLRRYRTDETDDGLSGSEGAFLWCSFWLVRNLLQLGRLDDAIALYQRLLSHSNHLGLFSEMVDPTSGEALGNFPQALTHLAVIITGLELTHAIEEKKTGAGGSTG
ncbi:MAG: glycoside hydrolase family 15 protein [Dehalococcoidia bacterium]